MQVNIGGKECRLVICLHPISVSIHLYIIRPPPWKKGSHAPVASHSRYPISPLPPQTQFYTDHGQTASALLSADSHSRRPVSQNGGFCSTSLSLFLKSKLSFRCNCCAFLTTEAFLIHPASSVNEMKTSCIRCAFPPGMVENQPLSC